MTDIFVSYAREDEERVKPIVELLKGKGWGVFWDRSIPPGKSFYEHIEEQLDDARCVVVIWSKHSVVSDWVLAEAEEGKIRKILVPLLIDEIRPRIGFRHLHAADLTTWNHEVTHPQFRACIDAIAALVPLSVFVDESAVSNIVVSPEKQPIIKSQTEPEPQCPENFVLIHRGRFLMGSPETEVDRIDNETLHEVEVSDFWMCKYALTVGEFREFIKYTDYRTDAEVGNGSYIWNGKEWKETEGINWRHGVSGKERLADEENHPVLHVSWNDARAFCEWFSKKTGKSFRLPTEAEWEYACRAGEKTPFNTGENLTTEQANYDGNYPYNNQKKGEYRQKTVAVDSFEPNKWGLYNMHGNVWEWCSDWYGSDYYKECKAQGVSRNPEGPAKGSYRVLRGGGWFNSARYCRSAFRTYVTPGNRRSYVGFRLVFVP